MEYTTIHNLKKPGHTDHALINDINDNMDILDSLVPMYCSYVELYNTMETEIVGNSTTKIPFTVASDTGNHWVNNAFVAPTTGAYIVTGSLLFKPYQQNDGDKYHVMIYIDNNSSKCIANAFETSAFNIFGINFAGIVLLTSGQVMDLWLYRAGATSQFLYPSSGYNHMLICKL